MVKLQSVLNLRISFKTFSNQKEKLRNESLEMFISRIRKQRSLSFYELRKIYPDLISVSLPVGGTNAQLCKLRLLKPFRANRERSHSVHTVHCTLNSVWKAHSESPSKREMSKRMSKKWNTEKLALQRPRARVQTPDCVVHVQKPTNNNFKARQTIFATNYDELFFS